MADFIGNAISAGQRRIEGYREAAAMTAPTTNPVFSAAGDAGGSAYAQLLGRHTEQYRHYVGWPYVAINRIATRLSGQPCHIGRKISGPTGRGTRLMTPLMRARAPEYVKVAADEYEILPSHHILDELARPNDIPHFVTSSLFFVTVASLELTGKAFWWRPPGGKQIWHFPSHWVKPVHTDQKLYAYYDVTTPNRISDPEHIPGEEVLIFALPDPSDPHGSVSPGQTQAPAIATDEAIQMSQARGFKNGQFPGMLLTVGRRPDYQGKQGTRPILTRSQRKDLIEAIRAVYEGVENYNEPLILDGLIEDAKKFTNSVQEMDYLNSGKQTKARIMQAFGVNSIVAGENIAAGWAQATVADQIFTQNVVNPLGAMIGQVVTRHLREMGEQDVMFWIEEASPRDPELKTRRFTVGLTKGACTFDEYRHEMLNLPPLEEGGDERLPQKPPGPTGAPPAPEEQDEEKPEEEDGPPARPGPKHAIPEKLVRMAGALRVKQLAVHEADIEETMARFFRRVAKRIGTETRRVQADSPQLFSEAGAATVRAMVYNEIDWEEPLRRAAHEPLVRAAVTGYFAAKSLMEERLRSIKGWADNPPTEEELALITSWELPSEVATGITEVIGETLDQGYWKKILETVGEDIESTIQRAAKEGWSQYKTTKALVERVGDPKRAKRIANTESTNALNAGHNQQAEEMERTGLHVIKIWNTIIDLVTREEHVDMNGEEVAGAAGLFNVAGYEVPWPGHFSLPAESRINCRCGYFTDLQELRAA